MSEVYTGLKSLPGGLGLGKCSRVFENRGFLTLSALKYLRPGDIDAFLRNQGDCRPGKQENTAKPTGTFSEVQ